MKIQLTMKEVVAAAVQKLMEQGAFGPGVTEVNFDWSYGVNVERNYGQVNAQVTHVTIDVNTATRSKEIEAIAIEIK